MTRNIDWQGSGGERYATVEGQEFMLKSGYYCAIWHLYRRGADGQFGYVSTCLFRDRDKVVQIAARDTTA